MQTSHAYSSMNRVHGRNRHRKSTRRKGKMRKLQHLNFRRIFDNFFSARRNYAPVASH